MPLHNDHQTSILKCQLSQKGRVAQSGMNDTLMSAEVIWTFTCFIGACGNFHWIWVKWYNIRNLGESVLASLLPSGHLENIYFIPRNPLGKNINQLEFIWEISKISSEYFFKDKWSQTMQGHGLGYKKTAPSYKMWMPLFLHCKTLTFYSKLPQNDESLLDFICSVLF